MKALIVDNEVNIRKGLIGMLNRFCPNVTEIKDVNGVSEAFQLLNIWQPDILFVDVEMDDGTGMDLLAKLEQINFHVIFITAFNKYAIDAFKFNAVDFLQKPIEPEELIRAVNKVIERNQLKNLNEQFKNLHLSIVNQSFKKLVLKDQQSIYYLDIDNIIRCESSGAYTTFYTLDNQKITVSRIIKEFEEILEPHQFIRVHQSHLINKKMIVKFDKFESILHLNENHQVPVSQRKRDVLIDLF